MGKRGIGTLILVACVSDTTGAPDSGIPGSEGHPCVDGQCLPGLVCLSNVCVRPAPSDAGSDVSTDAPPVDATPDGPTTIGDFTNPSNWTSYDLSAVYSGTKSFYGGGFDGRYLYLVPHWEMSNATVLRYDTQAALTTTSSWTTFDVATVTGAKNGFAGAAFDGKYLYLVPWATAGSSPSEHGVVARYDTTAPFAIATSWATFDIATINSSARGFAGAVYDGKALYFVPCGYTRHANAVRFDTTQTFTTAPAWTLFALSNISAGGVGYIGGTFDSKYVYFAKYDNDTGAIPRFDTTATGFSSSTSWQVQAPSQWYSGAKGFGGAVYDGANVNFVPYSNGGSYDGLLVRYQASGIYGVQASWTTFDLATVKPAAKGYTGSTYDGQYVYFAPADNPSASAIAARCNVSGSIACTTFDIMTLAGSPHDFRGAIFDGHFVYFIPNNGGKIVRFFAQAALALPPTWKTSFY